MSKKDFQAIAAAMYRAKPSEDNGTWQGTWTSVHERSARMEAWRAVRDELIPVLRGLNPRFNAELFREACETGRCRGMRAA